MKTTMKQGDDQNLARGAGNQESLAIVSCPFGPDDVNFCYACHDEFEQFFNEETEEWQLRSAVRIEDKFYHPICYEDYKVRLQPVACTQSELIS